VVSEMATSWSLETGHVRNRSLGAESSEDLIDHEGWPEESLEEREQILPKRVSLLPEVHEGSENAKAVKSSSTGGTCVTRGIHLVSI